MKPKRALVRRMWRNGMGGPIYTTQKQAAGIFGAYGHTTPVFVLRGDDAAIEEMAHLIAHELAVQGRNGWYEDSLKIQLYGHKARAVLSALGLKAKGAKLRRGKA